MILRIYLRIALFSLPLQFVLFFFIVFDPFGIIQKRNSIVEGSGDIQAFENFDKYNPTMAYNAFVFGNSRTLAFKSYDWKNYVKTDKIFCFGAPGECILNISKKLDYLCANENQIKHVIILLDEQIVSNYNNTSKGLQGPVYLHHPESTGKGYLNFYLSYIRFYFTNYFYSKFIYYKITNSYKYWMEDAFINPTRVSKLENEKESNVHNESDESAIEREMELDFSKYYKQHDFSIHKIIQPKQFHNNDVKALKKIKSVFEKQRTDFRIIISPNYQHLKFPESLKDTLVSIFGAQFIFDFSSAVLSNSDSTYYMENAHYNSKLGAIMLKKMYAK